MGVKKAQFAVFDVILMLVFIFTTYFIFQQDLDSISLEQSTLYDESQLLLFLSTQDEFLDLVFLENLTTISLSENWENISLMTGLNQWQLHLNLGNIYVQKNIFRCDSQKNLLVTRDFYIDNLTLELRFVEFGVCK